MKTSKALFLLVLFSASALTAGRALAGGHQPAYVEEVLSGDTVRLRGGKTLRYIGLEAPPLQHLIPLVRVYGANSKAFNENLVLHKKIYIDWGRRIRDSRNNLLGYVYLENGTFVNLEILKAGQAKARISAPDLDFADLFRKTALDAERARAGVWKEEPKNPYLQHAYIGDKNTKVYYLPNSPELDRLPQSYLITFNSRVEATAAGYRACDHCKETVSYGDTDTTLY